MEWKKKIQKSQVSTNDDGYFSSFVMQQSGNHIHLLFNDNLNNYDPVSKKFLDLEIPQWMNLSAKKNAVAHVDIDVESGDIERSVIWLQKEVQTIFIPKNSTPSKEESSILLVTSAGKFKKFGRIVFE